MHFAESKHPLRPKHGYEVHVAHAWTSTPGRQSAMSDHLKVAIDDRFSVSSTNLPVQEGPIDLDATGQKANEKWSTSLRQVHDRVADLFDTPKTTGLFMNPHGCPLEDESNHHRLPMVPLKFNRIFTHLTRSTTLWSSRRMGFAFNSTRTLSFAILLSSVRLFPCRPTRNPIKFSQVIEFDLTDEGGTEMLLYQMHNHGKRRLEYFKSLTNQVQISVFNCFLWSWTQWASITLDETRYEIDGELPSHIKRHREWMKDFYETDDIRKRYQNPDKDDGDDFL